MKNRDRDEKHRRRREAGSEEEDDPDGKAITEKLYDGLPTDTDPSAG